MSRILDRTNGYLNPVLSQERKNDLDWIPRFRGAKLSHLVANAMKVTDASGRSVEIHWEEMDPWQVLTDCFRPFQVHLSTKGVSYIQMAATPIPKKIRMDVARLKQILETFISNAAKYTQSGFVLFKVELKNQQNNYRIIFEVRDSGVGIDQNQMGRIFNLLPVLSPDLSLSTGGKRSGLAISQLFANLLGGTITCESVPGQGSAFRLEIPVDPLEIRALHQPTFESSDGSSKAQEAKVQTPPNERFAGTILLVDDNPDNLTILGYHLRRLGLKAEFASDGQEGLRKILEKKYDLVFMDMQMPVLDGWTATRKLRERGYQGAIIGLTASTAPEECKACLEAGANQFLTKPINVPQMVQVLKTWLGFHGNQVENNGSSEQALKSDYADDPDILPLIKSYLVNLEEMVAELEKAIEQKDWNTTGGIAHKIKGSGGMYGYPAITAAAAALEACAKAGEGVDVSRLQSTLKSARAHPSVM